MSLTHTLMCTSDVGDRRGLDQIRQYRSRRELTRSQPPTAADDGSVAAQNVLGASRKPRRFVLCNLCACCAAAKLDFQITPKQWETENLIFFSPSHPLIIIPVYSSGSLSIFFLNVLSECGASVMKPAGSTLRPR